MPAKKKNKQSNKQRLVALYAPFIVITPELSLTVILRLHATTGCQTGCTTGLTTGWMFVYTIQPVVKPAIKPV